MCVERPWSHAGPSHWVMADWQLHVEMVIKVRFLLRDPRDLYAGQGGIASGVN